MASINASTSGAGGVITTADATGTLQLQSGGTTIATISSTGLQQNVGAPAFSAYVNGSQTVSANTVTKIQFNTETFDTANCFDNTTNYRFTPNVAGYYQFITQVQIGTSYTAGSVSIRKSGGVDYYGIYTTNSGINAMGGFPASVLLYMNGTTDYVEVYVNFVSTQAVNNGPYWSFFQGFLARSA
jgi:hypothetical protein